MSDEQKPEETKKPIKEVSKCCKGTFHSESGDEGTSFYRCDKCNQPCDVGLSSSGQIGLTEFDKEEIVRKLEPYLKCGLSVRKACLETGVPKSTVYDLISEDTVFADKIKVLQQHISVLFSDTAYRIVQQVAEKAKIRGKVSKPELEFAKWYGMTSRGTKDEFSERKEVGFNDPEAEIKRLANLIDSATEKKEEK